MVVLLDATGSMTAVRGDGVVRYDQAKVDAAARVLTVAGQTGGLSKVAVYKFFGAGIVLETTTSPDGFVTPTVARAAILASAVTFEVTPLAKSMCDTVDIARASGTGATTERFLEVYTDGDENATDPLHPCFGPPSVSTTQPFDAGPPPSWQNLVYARTTNPLPAVTVDPTLYHDVSFGFAPRANPEAARLAALGRSQASAALAAGLVPDAEFFAILARDTGGVFTEVVDSAPVPVVADLDGDFDVDRNDAIILARRFGAPAFPAFDLDDNGAIGFGDYAMLIARFGNGTGTPAPDPYTPSPTINCVGPRTITIDGKVIENGGITIQGTGACRVIIRNSLIVSGAAAVRIRGAAILQVDNTIIVGEGQWLDLMGAATLSAAGTVFHGPQSVFGALLYIDRGGNIFEK